MLDRAEELLQRQQEGADAKESELEKRIAEFEADPRFALDLSMVNDSLSGSGPNIVPHDFGSLTATGMYDQVVTSEKIAMIERTKRQDTELYLNKILRSIEQKTPMIAAQVNYF